MDSNKNQSKNQGTASPAGGSFEFIELAEEDKDTQEGECGNALSEKETSLSGETNVQSWCSLASTVRHIRCLQFIIFFRPTAS